jgi:DNA-binding beta-propeller fold protein YncE
MAVSNTSFDVVTLYSLPNCEKIRSVGGYGTGAGKFARPWGVCFTSSGNLLVAEASNQRVQEVTVTGDHLRFVGVGAINGLLVGVDANQQSIVTSQHGQHRIAVFDFATGELRHSFGTKGRESGQLFGNAGVRLTPSGSHILVCEAENSRVSMFTLQGEFVKCFGSTEFLCAPRSVCVTDAGELVVANRSSHCVSVSCSGLVRPAHHNLNAPASALESASGLGNEVSADEPATWKRIGSQGLDSGCFGKLADVVVHRGKVFVLDNDTNRVQVFE